MIKPALEASFHARRGGFEITAHLQVPERGITALFGPSGCGKTSVLRCIAGLEPIVAGSICFRSQVWQCGRNRLAPHRRKVGLVFQEANLFDHLTVESNLLYGWKRSPPQERKIDVDQVVAWLGLAELRGHYPAQLSGGQRQRVAIARALLASPQLLLMDEPLASLDAPAKLEILGYLEQLHSVLDIPILYVSHALDEIQRLADFLVLMDRGGTVSSGPVNEMLTDATLPLAQLDEAAALLTAQVIEHDPEFHLTYVQASAGRIALSRQNRPIGQKVRVRIRAADVSLALTAPRDSSINNILPAEVITLQPATDPALVLVQLALREDRALARITRRSVQTLQLRAGSRVFAQVKTVSLMRG